MSTMLLKPQRLVKRAGLSYSRVYNKLGSATIVLLITLIASLLHSVEATDVVVHLPFRVVWNIPDNLCKGVHYKTLVSSDLEVNEKNAVIGNTIATLDLPGRWPVFKDKKPMHGGIPQCTHIDLHLADLKKTIVSKISSTSTGNGVIRQELWRVPYELNDNDFQIYRYAAENWFYPKKSKATAQTEWERSASEFMVKTLMTAKQERPDVHWGYYMYPQTWGANTASYNDRMAAIYGASTGLYPSISIKNPKDSYKAIQQMTQNTIAEALRVRGVHTNQEIPLFAYSSFSSGTLQFFNKSLLDIAIRLPAEMGIEGVILWETSAMFQPNPLSACKAIEKYVKDTLGPYVSSLLKDITECSRNKCNAMGRCVSIEYAKTVPFVRKPTKKRREINDGIKISNNHTKRNTDDIHEGSDDIHEGSDDIHEAYVDTRSTVTDKFAKYECQCYPPSFGPICEN